jgi:hypothetical protein
MTRTVRTKDLHTERGGAHAVRTAVSRSRPRPASAMISSISSAHDGRWRCGRGPCPQQRPGAVRGDAEFAAGHVVASQLHRGAVDRGDLQALPQQADSEVRVRVGGVELEQALHYLLAEQLPGLGERAAGRDIRARPGPQAGQPERRRQHRVVAGTGEQARDQDADHGHLRGQHPVVLMARGRLPQRAGDHVLGEQLFQQALPAQLRQLDWVLGMIARGQEEGARLVCGGSRADGTWPRATSSRRRCSPTCPTT